MPLGKPTREETGEVNQEKGLRDSLASSDGALSTDLLEFRQKYPQSTLLRPVNSLVIALTTGKEYRQLTESGFLVALQAPGYRISAKRAQDVSLRPCT